MWRDNKIAWMMLLPSLVLLGILGVVPLLAVFNYSFFDIFILTDRYWVGLEWYRALITTHGLYLALGRSLLFMTVVLLVQFPLGLGIAMLLPRKSAFSPLFLMVLAIPLVVPWNMIPIIWLNLMNHDFGMLFQTLSYFGWTLAYKTDPLDMWVFLVLVDTWHWVGLITILAYAGLSNVPQSYLQAAAIDGASGWQVFWHIQLPRLKGVLLMALLLRSMDSLMIYTEAFALNAGGPDGATSFLSLELGEEIAAFDYGPAAARSVVYFLIVLAMAYVFQRSLRKDQSDERGGA